jgi:hypothetical protein
MHGLVCILVYDVTVDITSSYMTTADDFCIQFLPRSPVKCGYMIAEVCVSVCVSQNVQRILIHLISYLHGIYLLINTMLFT